MILEWIFYYDEAFHDRKITEKNKRLNIYADNASDIYLGVFNGYQIDKQEEINNEFIEFENKYKKIYTVESGKELKSTVIKKRNFKNGFASFNRNTINFYNDLFDIFINKDIDLHICLFSKTEYLVRNFLNNIYISSDIVNIKAFNYVIVKFLFNHRNIELLTQIINAKSQIDIIDILKKLNKFMLEVINEGINVKRMVPEVNSLSQIVKVLPLAKAKKNVKKSLEWNYRPIFNGFNDFLNSKDITFTDVELIIDEDQKTLKAARQVGKYKSKCAKSHENSGIRVSDILCHLFSEISLALQDEHDILEIENMNDYDFKTKRLLSLEWFKLTKDQFLLCKKIKFILNNHKSFDSIVNSGEFCDYAMLVFSYMNYIDSFKNFEDFENCLKYHQEQFNSYCTKDLEKFFNSIGTHTALNKDF